MRGFEQWDVTNPLIIRARLITSARSLNLS